jgi:hypothetical protein
VTTIKVTKIYDQTGAGNHFTQATLASMPALTLSALGGLPGLTFSGSEVLASAAVTFSTPYSFSTVYERTNSTAGGILGAVTTSSGIVAGNGANLFQVVAGSAAAQAASDAAFHAASAVLTSGGTNSFAVVDGVKGSTSSAGANTISALALRIGRDSGGNTITGTIMEVGIWPTTTFNSTQYGNLNTNQHSATNGYNF